MKSLRQSDVLLSSEQLIRALMLSVEAVGLTLHDLKNPFTPMLLSMERIERMIERGQFSDETALNCISSARKSADAIRRGIDRLSPYYDSERQVFVFTTKPSEVANRIVQRYTECTFIFDKNVDQPCSIVFPVHIFSALRENSWKSTPIEGVAGNLVIQQERPPNEAEAKSPSIRLFNAFVCPPRLSDLRSPPSSGRGRFGHLLHLVDRSRTNPWRKENAYRAPSAQVSKAPDPALIVHRQVFDSMIDAYLRRRPSPLLGKNRTQLHRCRGCRPRIRTGRRPAQARAAKIENAVKPAKGL